jgi:hypothetical protein
MFQWIRPAVHFCTARGWGCRPTSSVGARHQRRDLGLALLGIRFWMSSPHQHGSAPHRKSGAVSGVRAKAHGEPKLANTAMRCGSRVLRTGDEKRWPGIGCRPDQLLCLAAFSRKAGVMADASQGQLHCEGDTTGATSGDAPIPIQRLQGQVTTATPFRSRDGNRARSLRAGSVDTSRHWASSAFRRLRVASESALEARLSSGPDPKQGGMRACGMQKWPLVPVLNRQARHALDARIFSVTVVTLRSRMELQV